MIAEVDENNPFGRAVNWIMRKFVWVLACEFVLAYIAVLWTVHTIAERRL